MRRLIPIASGAVRASGRKRQLLAARKKTLFPSHDNMRRAVAKPPLIASGRKRNKSQMEGPISSDGSSSCWPTAETKPSTWPIS